ncbi:MAG: efflux RND transporter permease subunit [Pseudomonadota bacterium]
MQASATSFKTAPALAFFKNPYLLALTLLIILLGGFSALSNIPRIEDPRITPRYPRVTTLLPGASAARVEALVTDVIEDSLLEIAEIKKIESRSMPSISIVNIELADEVGPGENEQIFSEIQNQLKDIQPDLPADATQPFFNDKNNAVAFSKIVAIRWTQNTPPELGVMSRLAEELADSLRAISGTDLVRIYGQPDEEIRVDIDAAELAALNMTTADVARAIAAADTRLPAGTIRGDERSLFVEVDAEIDSLARIRRIPLRTTASGAVVTVGSVATITKATHDPPADLAFANGARSILVAAQTNEKVRLDQWAIEAREAVEAFKASSGGGLGVDTVFDQNVYTEERLSTLGNNLLAGAALVVLVVFFAMGFRAALIVGSSLPLSAAISIFALGAAGQQLHQMAIFGMIIAIGLLIDNAIVVTDQVKKHLDDGDERWQAVQKALAHLFIPLLASTLTTILGFMPVFLLPGAMGDFVGPIAIAVVFALMASFFTAVTLIPSLGGLFMRRRVAGTPHVWWRDGVRSKRVAAAYRRLLETVLSFPRLAVLGGLVLPVAGFVLASTLGEQFFPPADRNQFEIEVRLSPSSTNARTTEMARQIEGTLREYPTVKEVHWRIGGTYPTVYYNRIMREQSNDAFAHAIVFVDTVKEANALTRQLPVILGEAYPEAQIVVAPFAQGPPVDAPVGFEIIGPDVATLREIGEELRRIMHTVDGVLHTRATVAGGAPKLDFVADEFAATEAGFTLTDIAAQMQSDLDGRAGGALLEDLEELPVVVRLSDADRKAVSGLEHLLLTNRRGTRWVPANSLGELALRPELSSISRRNNQRSNDVLGYIGRDVLAIDVTNEILAELDRVNFTLPPGYRLRVAGDSEQSSNALGQLLTYLPIILMLMIATIVLSFRSVRLAGIIGLVAVLSIGLGLLSLWIGGYARGFNAIIGSVGLVGVAINGTIVVLAAIRARTDSSGGDKAAIVRETMGATRHIVSTTLTTVGGFVPLLVFSGGDFWPPLAIVIAGGVAFSITLSLLFTPALYSLVCGWRAWSIPAEEEAIHTPAEAAS